MEQSIFCPICKKIFKSPKILSCNHTLCELCISSLYSRTSSCPVCGSSITISASQLPSNKSMEQRIKSVQQSQINLQQRHIHFNERLECSICIGPANMPKITKCGHLFCSECLDSWTTNNKICPECRTEV